MSAVDHDATAGVPPRARPRRPARDDDGHRAWVVRDALEKLPPPEADELREARSPASASAAGAPSTSRAAATAAAFAGLGVAVPPDDAPVVDRA